MIEARCPSRSSEWVWGTLSDSREFGLYPESRGNIETLLSLEQTLDKGKARDGEAGSFPVFLPLWRVMPHLYLGMRRSGAEKGLGFAEYEALMREQNGLGWV